MTRCFPASGVTAQIYGNSNLTKINTNNQTEIKSGTIILKDELNSCIKLIVIYLKLCSDTKSTDCANMYDFASKKIPVVLMEVSERRRRVLI